MAGTGAKRSLLEHCSALEDPRQAWTVLYSLPEVLLLVLCATLAGAEDFVETRLWGRKNLAFLRRFVPFAHGALDAHAFARAVRAHWGVENRLHWVLDVVFHDDPARLRTGHGPENMAVVKHMAMNLVRQASPPPASKTGGSSPDGTPLPKPSSAR